MCKLIVGIIHVIEKINKGDISVHNFRHILLCKLAFCIPYKISPFIIEVWCNGSTTDFGSVSLGSSPDASTNTTTIKIMNNEATKDLSIIKCHKTCGCIVVVH